MKKFYRHPGSNDSEIPNAFIDCIRVVEHVRVYVLGPANIIRGRTASGTGFRIRMAVGVSHRPPIEAYRTIRAVAGLIHLRFKGLPSWMRHFDAACSFVTR